MSSSITQRVLGNNTIYTDNYYNETFLLTKSLTIYCKDEVELYNKLVEEAYGVIIDRNHPETWRYYHHLAGIYHAVDRPIQIVSLDNGSTITLNKENMALHRTTRNELLKFDYQYKLLVDQYPDQELLIKSILNTSTPVSISDIVNMDNWTIVGYNASLVEQQETNLIPELQRRLDNYKVHRLHTSYGLIESYYLANLFAILYHFLFKTLLAIRLDADKTELAHSYHILNYLSSHHGLDKHYRYLTRKQIMFLYRNLLYLNNHSGSNEVFETLIDRLFTEKRVTVVGYDQRQRNSTTANGAMEYRYSQILLNSTDLVYQTRDFELEDMRQKEVGLYPGNSDEYAFELEDIDHINRNGLRSEVRTKDLEINLVDNSNDVPRKLIEVIVDYWAYLMSLGKMNFISTIIDPVSNKEFKLTTQDMFKLYCTVIHLFSGRRFERFETYTSHNVFMPNLPTKAELETALYRKEWTIRKQYEELLQSVPSYVSVDTAYAFNLFSGELYLAHLNQWLNLTSQADKDVNAQLDIGMGNITWTKDYHFDGETLDSFLNRINFLEVLEYSPETVYELSMNILNAISYNKLGELERNKHVQSALVDIFKQFNSYTTQIVDKYYSDESMLANLKSPLYTLDVELYGVEEPVNTGKVLIDLDSRLHTSYKYVVDESLTMESSVTTEETISIIELPPDDTRIVIDLFVPISIPTILDPIEPEDYPEIDQEYLLFHSTLQ